MKVFWGKFVSNNWHLVLVFLLVLSLIFQASCTAQEINDNNEEVEDVDATSDATQLQKQPATSIQQQVQQVSPPQNKPQQVNQQLVTPNTQQTQSTLPQKLLTTEFIEIIDREFVPLNLEIPVNTTVIWMHKDDFRPLIQHMIKVRNKGVANELAKSEKLVKEQNLTYKFTVPGTYEYMDVLFLKDMGVGKIVVK